METSGDDFVMVFAADDALGFGELQTVRALLESNGISTYVRCIDEPHLWQRMPDGPQCIKVPASRFEEAKRVLAEAQESGPDAAEEAEAAWEAEHPGEFTPEEAEAIWEAEHPDA
jgi:hypothetical protein